MSNYDNLLTRLDAGFTKPIATPPEFPEAAAAIRELQNQVALLRFNMLTICKPVMDSYAGPSRLIHFNQALEATK